MQPTSACRQSAVLQLKSLPRTQPTAQSPAHTAHSTAGCACRQPSPAQSLSRTQHSTAQHSAAQHSIAQQGAPAGSPARRRASAGLGQGPSAGWPRRGQGLRRRGAAAGTARPGAGAARPPAGPRFAVLPPASCVTCTTGESRYGVMAPNTSLTEWKRQQRAQRGLQQARAPVCCRLLPWVACTCRACCCGVMPSKMSLTAWQGQQQAQQGQAQDRTPGSCTKLLCVSCSKGRQGLIMKAWPLEPEWLLPSCCCTAAWWSSPFVWRCASWP